MQARPSVRSINAASGALLCAAFLGAFYLIGWCAAARHSPTIDEPLHAVGAYLHVFEHDYRVDAEDPPLWNHLAMLPHHRGELKDPAGRADLWPELLDEPLYGFMLTSEWLFQTGGNDGVAFIAASRAWMLVLGVILGAAIAMWSWRLGGIFAAVVACALFAMDPNFLAHGPLVKNDLAVSLLIFCTAFGAWGLGQSVRWWNLLAAALACAAAPAVKYSGLITLPVLLLPLLVRAMLPVPWTVLGMLLKRRTARLVAALALSGLAGGCTVLLIWASYGFRFDPTPVPGQRLAIEARIDAIKVNRFFLANGRNPTPTEQAELPQPMVGRLMRWLDQHRLLPQAWINGFLFTYGSGLVREAYLLGEHRYTGWWYYFPLAMLFKTPLATLAALAGALVICLHRQTRLSLNMTQPATWALVCLAVPLLIYGGASLTSHLNLGIRHVLPLYPFLFVAAGVAAERMRRSRPQPTLLVTSLLLAALAGETAWRFPHYVSFFNAAAWPSRLALLSDSNLDWGQDLTYVAEWQRQNPATPLYLGYWGAVDPAFYGIHYTNIPGGFILNRQQQWPPSGPGVLAISAGLIQGVNCPPEFRQIYPRLQEIPPRQILGNTIYLYDWPPANSP